MHALVRTLAVRAFALALFAGAAGSAPALAAGDLRADIFNAGASHAVGVDGRVSPDLLKRCGVQFTYTLSPNQTALFFTFNWPSANYIDWTVMNDSFNSSGQADVTLSNIATQRVDNTHVTYWLTVQNLTSSSQSIEGRYCYLH